ncbi:hypothetical protein [Mesorhizobium sp.]|uniref:hypothetical protein n=1 Tax=Mesorhizobium sp. TaxID=1871066 RepID=UPI001243455D|nr:hypothetical protein [Mesorhizobium sp.]TGT56835.1 hypothetical protein EN813_041170 [Mesorhizobium sp. M00.F.Ca.ET.170.01.1.1]
MHVVSAKPLHSFARHAVTLCFYAIPGRDRTLIGSAPGVWNHAGCEELNIDNAGDGLTDGTLLL